LGATTTDLSNSVDKICKYCVCLAV